MVKKSTKKEKKKLGIELVRKRRMTKPAVGKAEAGSFSHVKDKIMRSELVDRDKRKKKTQKQKVRRGRAEAEAKGEDPEALGFPARQEPNTIEKMRETDVTVIDEHAALDEEIARDEDQDEFSPHFNFVTEPKIMLTTNLKPSKKMFSFLKELAAVLPNTKYYKRKGLGLKQILEYAKKRDFTLLLVVTENKTTKKPNGLYLCNLPCGPTSFWKLTKLKLGQEMRGSAPCNAEHAPELLLNNFSTRLGRRIARQIATIFPQKPDFHGRRSITFHNQRDFVFFRHYRYEFKAAGGGKKKKEAESDDEESSSSSDAGSSGAGAGGDQNVWEDGDEELSSEYSENGTRTVPVKKKDGRIVRASKTKGGASSGKKSKSSAAKVKKDKNKAKKKDQEDAADAPVDANGEKLVRAGLKEIGPRFTLKLRYLQQGTFDSKNGEYEFQWRPDSQVSRKKMFL
eukprot:g14656.t1